MLCFSLPASSGWTELKTIKEGRNWGKISTMYTDSSTNIHHFASAETGSSAIHYMQVDADLNIIKESTFLVTDCSYTQKAFVRGPDNGKDLIIVVEGEKYSGSRRISDLWYAESSNNGKTWTQWYKIDHSADQEHRSGDTVLWIKETGRVFIFYEIRALSQHYPCMVTKAPGSTTFSKEKILTYNYKVLDILGADYTISTKKQPVLHLFFGNNNETSHLHEIMYMNSTDQGTKWSTPVSVSGKDYCNAQDWSTGVLGGRANLATILVAYALETPTKMMLAHSESHGKKFKTINATNHAVAMFHPSYRAVAFALCGPNPKKLYLFSFIQTDSTEFEATVWDANKLTYMKLDHPVKGTNNYYGGHHISCKVNPKNSSEIVMTLAIGVVTANSSGMKIAEYSEPIPE